MIAAPVYNQGHAQSGTEARMATGTATTVKQYLDSSCPKPLDAIGAAVAGVPMPAFAARDQAISSRKGSGAST